MRQGSQRRQDQGFRIRIGALKAPPPRGKGAEAVTWASLRELTKSCRASNRWVSCLTFSPERMAAPSGLESKDTAHLSRAKDGSGFATTEIGQYLRHPNAASHRGTTEAYFENPAHKFFNDRVDPEYVRPWVLRFTERLGVVVRGQKLSACLQRREIEVNRKKIYNGS